MGRNYACGIPRHVGVSKNIETGITCVAGRKIVRRRQNLTKMQRKELRRKNKQKLEYEKQKLNFEKQQQKASK